jgi:hypothetical protein
MEEALLDIAQGGITADTIMLIVQLVVAAFLALWLKGWIRKTWAWRKFQKSTLVALGTEITVTINGARAIKGTITSASKGNIVVENDRERAVIKTTKFVGGDYDWVIHKRVTAGECANE